MSDDIRNKLDKVPFGITNPELIPTKRYHDETFFQCENEHLWPHVWQMACRLEEIPDIGNYAVYNILDKSVIIINTSDGIRAFHNACRHRGVRLAHGPGTVSNQGFTCPFHGWRYNENGNCTFVYGREIFSEYLLEASEINLDPVRLESWSGCAFINFDDDAPSLLECLGPVAGRMDARHADKLRAEWWCGTILPSNWKLAMEAFQESYHVMETHPQLYEVSYKTGSKYGSNTKQNSQTEPQNSRDVINTAAEFMARLSTGMDGMVHNSEVAVIEKLRDMELPDDPDLAYQLFHMAIYKEVTKDARNRGVPMFDIMKVIREVKFNAVEFMFPNFFLLPMIGSMASYRIRPLSPETCFFEIWSLTIPAEGEDFESPCEPTILPYDSDQFPEIPRQDYSNIPLQQRGLHNLEYMRLGAGGNGMPGEGMISNYQRLIDGYLAALDAETLANASRTVNSGFDAPILDIGF